MDPDFGDELMMPRTVSKSLSLDIQRMASIEDGSAEKREGHALSPSERALILEGVPAAQKAQMYAASLRKRSLDLPRVHAA